MDLGGDTSCITIVADPGLLSTLRMRVAALARETGADAATVADFELVVSELATNVIRHADGATELTVLFAFASGHWVLDVSNADDLVSLAEVRLPADSEPSGRGLFIVESLMDAVELVDIDGHQHIRCFKAAA